MGVRISSFFSVQVCVCSYWKKLFHHDSHQFWSPNSTSDFFLHSISGYRYPLIRRERAVAVSNLGAHLEMTFGLSPNTRCPVPLRECCSLPFINHKRLGNISPVLQETNMIEEYKTNCVFRCREK